MCEIMTIAAALLFAALAAAARNAGRPARALGTTALVFTGAALMWSVDCVANAMDGEGLLDMSREDTLLGGIIVVAGLAVFAVLSMSGRFMRRSAS